MKSLQADGWLTAATLIIGTAAVGFRMRGCVPPPPPENLEFRVHAPGAVSTISET